MPTATSGEADTWRVRCPPCLEVFNQDPKDRSYSWSGAPVESMFSAFLKEDAMAMGHVWAIKRPTFLPLSVPKHTKSYWSLPCSATTHSSHSSEIRARFWAVLVIPWERALVLCDCVSLFVCIILSLLLSLWIFVTSLSSEGKSVVKSTTESRREEREKRILCIWDASTLFCSPSHHHLGTYINRRKTNYQRINL